MLLGAPLAAQSTDVPPSIFDWAESPSKAARTSGMARGSVPSNPPKPRNSATTEALAKAEAEAEAKSDFKIGGRLYTGLAIQF